MKLFHLRNFLFSLLPIVTKCGSLSAVDIPIELPSGAMIHLKVKSAYYHQPDEGLYSVCMNTKIVNPEEMQLSSNSSMIQEQIKNYLQKKWDFHDVATCCIFPLDLKPNSSLSHLLSPLFIEPTKIIASPIPSLRDLSLRELYAYSGSITITGSYTTTSGSITLNNGGLITGEATITGVDAKNTSLSSETNKPITDPLPKQFTHTETDSKKTASETTLQNSSLSSESQGTKTNNSITDAQPEFSVHIDFSLPSNGFGRGWCLPPYELRFIKSKDFFDKSKNNLDEMILVLTLGVVEIYQKERENPNFYPTANTSNTLRDNLNGTFSLTVPLQGEFLFNNKGQLIHSVNVDGLSSSYELFEGKLVRIHHENGSLLSFEYDGKQLVSINGLPNKICAEYDDQNFLHRIFDSQGSSLHFSYDEEGMLNKIVDDSRTILFTGSLELRESSIVSPFNDKIANEIPLLFNENREIFYYKNSKNIWKFGCREHDQSKAGKSFKEADL